MAEKYLFPEWRNEQAHSKYPFADSATLTNGQTVLPESLLLDARLFVIGGGSRQYLRRIHVASGGVYMYLGDESGSEIASGYMPFSGVTGTIELLDAYDRPAGVLVGEIDQLSTLSSWAAGDHEFTEEQTEFTATVTVPQPQVGVRGFLAEGKLFAGDVWIVGEQGVFLTMDGEYIRVDIVGDPLGRQRFCEAVFNYQQPWFVRTITGYKSDIFGDFKLLAGSNLASDTALRIEQLENGIGFKLIGNILPNAPE